MSQIKKKSKLLRPNTMEICVKWRERLLGQNGSHKLCSQKIEQNNENTHNVNECIIGHTGVSTELFIYTLRKLA